MYYTGIHMEDVQTYTQNLIELYESTHRDVFRYALRRTQSEHAALDIVSDTFAVVWTRIHLAPTSAEARLWVFGIARNILRNHGRSEIRRTRLMEKLSSQIAEIVDGPDADETTEFLVASLNSLDEITREIILLTTWEEMSAPEVARVLGMNSNTVRSRLRRGLAKVQHSLESHVLADPTKGSN